ncbi:glycosyltransferase family 4 protein [Paenibacillus lemnae]|uniref:Glycosyltransferase family 4 protein n=1 Tax=Paenibacillus lemnae TaxID=1330551 RepID=A0A848M690_PAELE|nr:glycosyltransferase family 4 protein [Paenibacillus lemnae]NMO95710.1 glycosyltransferase family 4 protein [Paenibacillus lemnae]
MKICFVTHKVKKGDGQGRVNYEIIKEAIQQGNKVIVVSTELSNDLRNCPSITWFKIEAKFIPTNLLKNQFFAVASYVLFWLRIIKADLIVVNGFITYAKSDFNCVHLVHSAWANSEYHPFRTKKNIKTSYHYFYNRVNGFLEKIAFKKTRHVIAVSDQVKRELHFHAKVNSSSITVIHNGVDTDEFAPKILDRRKYNLKDGTIYGLFAGDLNSGIKNFETVLTALTKIKDLELLVLGNAEKSHYPSMAKKLGINNRVHFLGYRSDISNIMSLADIFIFPSRYESFSLVILEAMAAGLPVITSDRCGVIELMTENSAFILSNPDNTDQLSTLIRSLINNPEKMNQMSIEARSVALQNQWTAMAKKYLEYINKEFELQQI